MKKSIQKELLKHLLDQSIDNMEKAMKLLDSDEREHRLDVIRNDVIFLRENIS